MSDIQRLKDGKLEFERPIVLVGLDGTLSDNNWRLHYVEKDPKQWGPFFDGISQDEPFPRIVDGIQDLNNNYDIAIVSGRPEDFDNRTEEWLERWEIPYNYLFTRRAGDYRPGIKIKKEVVDHIPRDKIALAVENRKEYIEMYGALGICVYIPEISDWHKGKVPNEILKGILDKQVEIVPLVQESTSSDQPWKANIELILTINGANYGTLKPEINPLENKSLWIFASLDGKLNFTVGPTDSIKEASDNVIEVLNYKAKIKKL